MADVLYFNGRFTTTDERVLGVEDRGFQFGDSIYEVLKFLGRTPLFTSAHFQRMARSARELELRLPWSSEEEFRATCDELLRRTEFEDGTVYVQISRGEGPRAHFYPENLEPTIVMYSRRFSFPDAARKKSGIKVVTASDDRWRFCRIKTVNLLPNLLAKKKAQRAGADEVLLIDNGVVTEGASSSFFAVIDGRICTHSADEGVLPGCVRDEVIRLALSVRIRVDERPMQERQLFDMQEAFVTSTTQGVIPIASIDGRLLGSGARGPVTTRLQQLFDERERAELAASRHSL